MVAERITSTIGSASGASSGSTVSVSALDEWVLTANDNQERLIQKFTLAVLGLVTVYIVIAMVNAVVISAGARRAEFAIARLTGLSRGQVVQTALWESLTVVAVGVVIGALAAGGIVVGVTIAVSDIVGTRVVEAPWLLFGAVTLGAAAIVGVTSVLTTLAATRQPAVVLAAARE
jgi:putative ABC transport system permease protein